jgi:hypothetical protein
MAKQEAMRRTMMNDALRSMGFSMEECEQLRRISLTLSHWAERECNEDIETRDDGTAWVTPYQEYGIAGKPYRIPNREAGALRRLRVIMSQHRGLMAYYQTDPRGAALYIIRRTRLREYARQSRWADRKGTDGNPLPLYALLDSCYSSVGMAVY